MGKHKHGSNKAQLRMGGRAYGSGIEGVVVCGGALLVAGLVAAFTINKGRNKDPTDDVPTSSSCSKEENGNGGLRSALQDPPSTLHQNQCCRNYETTNAGFVQIDRCEFVSTQSSSVAVENEMQSVIHDEHKNSASGQQEILVLSDTEQESIAVSYDGCSVTEEFSIPVLKSSNSDEPENMMIKTETEDSPLMDPIEIEIKDEELYCEERTEEKSSMDETAMPAVSMTGDEKQTQPTQSSLSPELSTDEEKENSSMQSSLSAESSANEEEEENSLLQSLFSLTSSTDNEEDSPIQSWSTEEEDEEVGYDEHVTEKGEESSEGSSSMESNTEAIWPAEVMELQATSPESTEMNIVIENIGENKTVLDDSSNPDMLGEGSNNSGSTNSLSMAMIQNGKETKELVMVNNDRKVHAIERRILASLMMVVLLLLLLLLAQRMDVPILSS